MCRAPEVGASRNDARSMTGNMLNAATTCAHVDLMDLAGPSDGNSTNLIAIHEASHAALYMLAGRQHAQIIELRADDSCGHCRVRYQQRNPHAIIAGYVGEMRVLEGQDWRPTPEMFSLNLHLQDIADAAALVGLDGLPGLWDETALVVDTAWDRIQAVAAALSVAGVLSGDEVEAIWAP